MPESLADILKNFSPDIIKGVMEHAKDGLKKDKMAIYELFIKNNKVFTYDDLDKILSRHENFRIDINWPKEDFIYRLVISKRKKKEEKPKNKPEESNNNGVDSNERRESAERITSNRNASKRYSK